MLTVEVALAEMAMVLETTEPFTGASRDAETPLLTTRVIVSVFGEPDAFGSEMVVVAICVPTATPVGFTISASDELAPLASEPDEVLNVSHDCVLVADQLSVVLAAPLFVIVMDCEEVAALPKVAEKLSDVEVATERDGADADTSKVCVE